MRPASRLAGALRVISLHTGGQVTARQHVFPPRRSRLASWTAFRRSRYVCSRTCVFFFFFFLFKSPIAGKAISTASVLDRFGDGVSLFIRSKYCAGLMAHIVDREGFEQPGSGIICEVYLCKATASETGLGGSMHRTR